MSKDEEAGSGCAAVLEPAEEEEEADSSAFRYEAHVGLCVNCELRDTCIRLKPAGGIWFCEEYR